MLWHILCLEEVSDLKTFIFVVHLRKREFGERIGRLLKQRNTTTYTGDVHMNHTMNAWQEDTMMQPLGYN